ncbi:tyrosine-type recombinase/integrase [Nonomuraea sp. NPDC059023]|uniref:tyrosine-type recombinase/integrase n=1 Tax=unclassified Nonomuraea TaxID=2593643 RepID=UPI003673931E
MSTAEHLPAVTELHGELITAAAALPRDRNPYWVYIDSLASANSRRTMRGNLDRLARILAGYEPDDPAAAAITGEQAPWHLLDYAHTTKLRARLVEKIDRGDWQAKHVNHHLVALRRVLKEAWRLGIMQPDVYQRARDIQNVDESRLPAGAHVPDEALAAALAECEEDESAAGRRDAALLAVLFTTGCRREEIATMVLADYDPADRSIRVVGKRNKQRMVYLTRDACAFLEAWLAVRGSKPGPLFFGYFKGAKKVRMRGGRPQHLSGQAIADIFARRLKEAGAVRRTPHDLRRTFIGNLLDEGVDLATAQALAGHSSPVTTSRYDRRPDRTRQEAVDRLTLPEPRKLRS